VDPGVPGLSFPLVAIVQQGLLFPAMRTDFGERRFHTLASAPKIGASFCKRIGCGVI